MTEGTASHMRHRIIAIGLGALIVFAIVGGLVYWEWPQASIGPQGNTISTEPQDHQEAATTSTMDSLPKFVSGPPPAEAAPTVKWTPGIVSQTIARKELKTVPVAFVASESLSDVVIRVTPELEAYVRVIPAVIASVAKGESISVDILITAPESAPLDAVQGTIQLRSGRTIAKPLPVTLSVVETDRILNQVGGYSVEIPSEWHVIVGRIDTSSVILLPPDKAPDPDSEYVGDIFVASLPNPSNRGLADFYSTQQVDLFRVARSYRFFQLNGLDAVMFDDVPGMLPSTIVSVRMEGRVVQITDFDESHQGDGIFSAVVSSIHPL